MTYFKTSDFQIVTCKCFSNYWKEIIQTKDESWKFDEIEKGKKTFRVMFGSEKTIFNCCHQCFTKKILEGDVFIHAGKGYCTFAVKNDGLEVEKVCHGCIWHFISTRKNQFYIF